MAKRMPMLFLVLLLMATPLASISCVQQGREWDRRETLPVMATVPDILLMDLNLTTGQGSKIASLRDTVIREIKPLQEKINREQENWQQEYGKGRTKNEADLERTARNIRRVQDEIQDKRAAYLQAVTRILTPEQNALLQPKGRGMGGGPDRQGPGMDNEPDGRGGPGGRQRTGW